MKLIFLGGFFSESFSRFNRVNSKIQIQNSANNFQWAFVKGLIDNSVRSLYLITAPYVGWYPKYYKKILIESSKFTASDKSYSGELIGFLNLPFIKNFFKYYKIRNRLISVIDDQSTTIIVYSIDTAYLSAAIAAKKKYPNIKISVIITDLFEYPGDCSVIYKMYLKYVENVLFKRSLKNIDSFVVLTEAMVSHLGVEKKPWVRIEGLYETSSQDVSYEFEQKDSSSKIILYSGTLDYQYGIDFLLDAFELIDSPFYNLWICGGGSAIELVKSRSIADSRIKYFGILSKEEVYHLQKKSTVLINPRKPFGDYNKYSFPSKTIEYFASGTPTILYKLDGIPDEYYEYCYTIEGESLKDMRDKIIEVCESQSLELEKKGMDARKFILDNKTSLIQCNKVLKMLYQLN